MLLQCVFAVILAIGCLILPESPRFLIKKGNIDRGTAVLAQLYGRDECDVDVQKECQDILNAVNYEAALGQASWKEMFTTMRRRSTLAIMVQTLAQLSGINIVTVRYITFIIDFFVWGEIVP